MAKEDSTFNLGALSTIREMAVTLEKTWGVKTVEEFRIEAEREQTGMAFEALRKQDGRRVAIIVCLTDVDDIKTLEGALKLVDDGVTEDWNALTLVDLAIRTAKGNGFAFESLHDEYGRRSSLILIATSPQGVQMIESALKLPG